MALLGTIRKKSGLLIIVIGVALAAFVLGDFFKPGNRRQMNYIGEINGEEIPAIEFNEKVEQNIKAIKQNQKKEQLTAAEVYSAKQTIWSELLKKIILGKEYEELGIVVTPDELFEQVQGETPHRYILQYFKDPETGEYDPQLVLNYLKQLDQLDQKSIEQWVIFEQAIKDDRIGQKYKNLVSKGYYVPKAFIPKENELNLRKAKLRIVASDVKSIPDSLVEITDNDYNKFYEENIHQYEQEASRDIDYVIFDVKPSADDRRLISQDVHKVYRELINKPIEDVPNFVNLNSDNRYDSTFFKEGELSVRIDSIMFNSPLGAIVKPYVENNTYYVAKLMDVQHRPDSMKATHILVSHKELYGANEEITRTKEEAKIMADSLLEVVLAKPEKFEEIAVEISDDPSVLKNSGNLGWFADGTMLYPFNQAVLEGKKGDVSIVETRYGYHIIRIDDKLQPTKKVRVAIIDRAIEPSNQTYQNVYTEASKFAGESTTLDAFESSITEKKLNKRSADDVKEMQTTIPGLDNPRGIIRWSFFDRINLGDVSPIFDFENSYVIAAVSEVREKGTMPMEQAKERMETLVLNEKKTEMLLEKMNAITSNDLYQIAKELDDKVDTINTINFYARNIPGFGRENDVIGEIFTLNEGEISKPIKGNGGTFIIQIDSIIAAKPIEDTLAIENRLKGRFKSRVDNNYVYRALEKKAEIVDNRLFFY